MPKPNGVVLYHGPSAIDRKGIVAIATGLRGASSNAKTGHMVQTWILRADVDPLQALRTGRDVSVCGGCIYRPKAYDGRTYSGRSCYVNVAQAPLNVWRTWQRGRYPTDWGPETFAGRLVRLGSYGDPAVVPMAVWEEVTERAASWTGYTHQARSKRLRGVLKWCQVSADSLADAERARDAGVGSFRVLAPGETPAPWETVCPASKEAGRKLNCAECLMCDGASGNHVAIIAHGIGARMVKPTNRRTLPVLN